MLKTIIIVILFLLLIVGGIFIYFMLYFPFNHNSTLDFKDITSIKIIPTKEEEHIEISLTNEQIETFYALLESDYENIRGQNVSDKKICHFKVRIRYDEDKYGSWLLYDNGVFARLNYFLEPRFRLHNYEEVYNCLAEIYDAKK